MPAPIPDEVVTLILKHAFFVASRYRLRCSYASGFDIDDLIQEACLCALDRLRLFDPVKSSLSTYIRTCCKNAVLDFLRNNDLLSRTERKKVKEGTALNVTLVSECAAYAVADEFSMQKTFDEEVAMMFIKESKFPMRDRKIINMFLNGATQKKIATSLGISETRVSQILGKLVSNISNQMQINCC